MSVAAVWNVAMGWGRDESCGGEGSSWWDGNAVGMGLATCFFVVKIIKF